MEPALLLNASYEPLKVVTWRRAIVLMLTGKVEVIEAHDISIHSVSLALRLPSVIRLVSYVRVRRKSSIIRFSRKNIFSRDGFICQYCESRPHNKELTLDHVIPVTLGGKKEWTNVVTACKPCNQKKGAKTPKQAGMMLLRLPRSPEWSSLNLFEIFSSSPPESWESYLLYSAV